MSLGAGVLLGTVCSWERFPPNNLLGTVCSRKLFPRNNVLRTIFLERVGKLYQVPVDLAAWCRRESVKGRPERRPERGVGMTPKTASKAAVFCRLPTDRQLLLVHFRLSRPTSTSAYPTPARLAPESGADFCYLGKRLL